MGKIKKLELTAGQYTALENGFRNGTSHCFRMRGVVLFFWKEKVFLLQKQENRKREVPVIGVTNSLHIRPFLMPVLHPVAPVRKI